MFALDLEVGDNVLVVGIDLSRKISIIICNRILIHGSVPNADFIQGRIQHHARAATGWQPSDEESIARCCFARSTSPEDRSWVCHNICRIPQWLQLTIDIDRNVRTAFDCHEDVRPVTNGNGSIRGKRTAANCIT